MEDWEAARIAELEAPPLPEPYKVGSCMLLDIYVSRQVLAGLAKYDQQGGHWNQRHWLLALINPPRCSLQRLQILAVCEACDIVICKLCSFNTLLLSAVPCGRCAVVGTPLKPCTILIANCRSTVFSSCLRIRGEWADWVLRVDNHIKAITRLSNVNVVIFSHVWSTTLTSASGLLCRQGAVLSTKKVSASFKVAIDLLSG